MPHVTLSGHRVARFALVGVLVGCSASSGVSQLPEQNVLQPAQGLSHQLLAQKPYHVIHPFGRSPGDGTKPASDLIDVKGTLYGTTFKGGTYNGRTVFSITPSGQETLLHSFGGRNDGYWPVAALLNVNGTLYGTTETGGEFSSGTVFKINPSGMETVIYSFGVDSRYHISNGSRPLAGLINVNGTLYGTTVNGGRHSCNTGYYSCGTVFSITQSGEYKLLHSFGESAADGTLPVAALVNVDGTLYGTTPQGGEFRSGTIFSITPAGQYKTVYSFGNDGSSTPMSALIDINGTLYGTTISGNNQNISGTVFITKSGDETVLHSFTRGEGVNPVAGVIAVGGTLSGTTYGSTITGGKQKRSFGNVFSLKR